MKMKTATRFLFLSPGLRTDFILMYTAKSAAMKKAKDRTRYITPIQNIFANATKKRDECSTNSKVEPAQAEPIRMIKWNDAQKATTW